jgi:hypothetical protein
MANLQSTTVTGNLAVDTSTLFVDSVNNRVGVKTTSPTATLNIIDGDIALERDGSASSPGTWPSVAPINILTWAADGPTSDSTIGLLTISAGRVNTTDTYANNAYFTRFSADDGVCFWVKVTGDTYIRKGLGVGTTPSGTAGEIRATNNVTSYYSDDRLKTRLGDIENALEKVCSLTGFYYEANDTAQELGYKAKREVGLSAQQVEKVLPEIVVPAPIDEKYKTIHYEKTIPLLVEAIKDLKKELDEIKAILKDKENAV